MHSDVRQLIRFNNSSSFLLIGNERFGRRVPFDQSALDIQSYVRVVPKQRPALLSSVRGPFTMGQTIVLELGLKYATWARVLLQLTNIRPKRKNRILQIDRRLGGFRKTSKNAIRFSSIDQSPTLGRFDGKYCLFSGIPISLILVFGISCASDSST
jgi:hypothetical protein